MSLRSDYYSQLAAGRDVSGHDGRPRGAEPETSVNGTRTTWAPDTWEMYAHVAGELKGPHRVIAADYFTPRPYVDEFNPGRTFAGFTLTVKRPASVQQYVVDWEPPGDPLAWAAYDMAARWCVDHDITAGMIELGTEPGAASLPCSPDVYARALKLIDADREAFAERVRATRYGVAMAERTEHERIANRAARGIRRKT